VDAVADFCQFGVETADVLDRVAVGHLGSFGGAVWIGRRTCRSRVQSGQVEADMR
jgi:hypothetical protein